MIVLADRGSERGVVEEEKQEWLNEVLLALNVPVDAFKLELQEMRDYLASVEIEVWEHADGNLDVFKGDEIVAQWKEPEYILIKDTPRKWYYEIHINAWARPLQELDV